MGDPQHHPELVIAGLPGSSSWAPAIAVQLRALARHWSLLADAQTVGEAPYSMASDLPLLERAYQWMDRCLFGRRCGFDAGRPDVRVIARDQLPAAAVLAWSGAVARRFGSSGGAPCIWVEYEGLPMSQLATAVRGRLGVPGATLSAAVWVLQEDGAGCVLFRGQLDLDHKSFCRSIALCAAKLPELLRGALARSSRAISANSVSESEAQSSVSSARQFLRLARTIANRLLWREQWHIVVHGPGGTPPQLISPPADAFWADPFLVRKEQRLWLMFEEWPFHSNKGHICAMQLDEQGHPVSGAQIALSESWHLSYPFPVQVHERRLMLPEAIRSGGLSLYECIEWPQRWTLRKTLLSGLRLADASVVGFGGRLWMFATHGDEGASMDDTLYLFWADEIEGPWHPHPLNPVKIDARSSRPAGAMWHDNGVLYRVVQDCSTVYGGAVRCMRVLRLDEHDFDEELVQDWPHARPDYSEPRHTFNRVGGVVVSDRLIRQPRWLAW